MVAAASSILIVACAGMAVPRAYARRFETVWAVNRCFECAKVKPDLVIAMDDFRRDEACEPGYVAKLFAGHDAPVMTTIASREWPRSRSYPLRKVIKALGLPRKLAERAFDNSCNYALALAIATHPKRIGLHGVAFTKPRRPKDWDEFAKEDWDGTKYRGKWRPDWFKYHGKFALYARHPTEPGSEAHHLLIGLALGRGIEIGFSGTTLLNLDRDAYFYGYQEQPHV